MTWSHNGRTITHDRAFGSLGEENCVLRIQNVTQEDEGMYTCTVCNQYGCCTSRANVTVFGTLCGGISGYTVNVRIDLVQPAELPR